MNDIFKSWKAKATKHLPSENWLAKAKDTAISARHRRTTKTPSFPVEEILKALPERFTEDDPKIFLVKFLDKQAREVDIKNREKPAKVIDVEVIKSELPEVVVEGETYSLWFSTVLETQYNEVKPNTEDSYILAYHGRYMKTGKPRDTDPHIWNIIPQ